MAKQDVGAAFLSQITDSNDPVTVPISREMVANKDLGPLPGLLDIMKKSGLLVKGAGRLTIVFPDFPKDREIFEFEECRNWILDLEKKAPFLCTLLHPELTFPLLLLSHVAFEKNEDANLTVPDKEQAVQTILDYGLVAYHVAETHGGNGRAFTEKFIRSVGMEQAITDELMAQYDQRYEEFKAEMDKRKNKD